MDNNRANCDSTENKNINLSFSDLSYSVNSWSWKQFPFRKEKKHILKEISGDFQAFQLTGIIGPSGSGKSSLLDILSGYCANFDGTVLHNGIVRDVHLLRSHSAYIMQDCSLQPLMTVKEAVLFSAQLKLGYKYSFKQKMSVVMDILSSLELIDKTESLTQTLSGGEMKRLAIALELVNNPSVMFFDEPTTGLDYHNAKNCLVHLKNLSCAGRNIICTLHQPSASMFEQLDHVYVLANGQCMYQGSTKGLAAFLDDLGLSCPEFHNPADHVLDVSMGEYGPYQDQLVNKINNGKSSDWRRIIDCHTIFEHLETPHSKKRKKDGSIEHSTTFFTQFSLLLLRTLVKISRDKVLTYFRLSIHCAVGFLLGLFYYGIGSDAAYVFDNFSLLFFSLMFLMFTALSSMIISFPLEMPIIIREHFNCWYSLKSFYLAMTVADTPIQVMCTLVYCVIVYMVSKQPPELFRFGLFLLMCTAVTMCTQAVGVLVGSTLPVMHGVIFGPLAVLPWLIFSGFFLHISDATASLQWLFHISFLKYAVEGVMLAIYGYGRGKIPCSDDYCHYNKPDKLLKELDMNEANYIVSLTAILMLYIAVKVLTYFVLSYKLSHKK